MSMKLLPAAVDAVNPSQPSDVSTSLVPLTQRAITARANQISLAPAAPAFAGSHSPRQSSRNRFSGPPVEDSQSDRTARSPWQYLSAGWAWSHSVQRTAIAHYFSYAADRAGWSGGLIDLYA
jgi:hypothetical protein